jgi:protein-S-isoprenylcysteine O-methyltransferase Ste14
MLTNLFVRACLSLIALLGVMGFLLFGSTGTIHYWQGWVYLSIFACASLITTIYLALTDRALLERRMQGGPIAESRPAQKVIMLVVSIGFIGLLIAPALAHRFQRSQAPLAVVVLGDVLVATGFLLIGLVYRENTFTSATIEIAQNQTVISTGPYAIVRHPMYASASLYLLGTPLALGSYWGLLPLAAITPFLVWRIFDEERLLAEELKGYREYQKRVRYRLIPFVW